MVQTLYKIVDQDITTSHYKRSGQRYVLKVRDLPQDEKPREKLNMLGPRHYQFQNWLQFFLAQVHIKNKLCRWQIEF
jgi:hypothetical protein